MYDVTLSGTKTTITYRAIGSVSQIKEGAKDKAIRKALFLGDDIRIRLTPVDEFILG